MTKEEKKAIEKLKSYKELFSKGYCEDCNELCAIDNFPSKDLENNIETILNLIEKQAKEIEEFQIFKEVVNSYGKNGLGEYSKRYFAEYRAIHHTAFYDFIPDPDEIYKKYYEQKKEIEKMQKEIEIKDNYMKLILDILYDYDGYFSRETNEGSAKDLADLIDETCDYLKKAILNDDKSDVYKSYIE